MEDDMVLENKGTQTTFTTEISRSHNNSSSNDDDIKDNRSKPRKIIRRKQVHMKKNKRVLMKRRRRSGSSRGVRGENGVERRVRTLKRLISKPENQGLEGLFRDAASYIMSLQMRVRVMRLMLHALSTSSQQLH